MKCLTLGLFAMTVGLGIASAATFNVTFDETTSNPAAPASGVESGYLVFCDRFDLNTSLCTGANISDYVSFFGGNIITFVSDADATGGLAADTGITITDFTAGNGARYVLEPANGIVVYDATGTTTPGAPLNGTDTNHFTITSDDALAPEPGTLLMLGTALAALAGVRSKLRRC